jgi:hypothetical protein
VRELQSRPPVRHLLLVPFHGSPSYTANLEGMDVYGVHFDFSTWADASSRIDYKEFLKQISHQLLGYMTSMQLEKYFTPVLSIVDARDERDAFDTVNTAFDLMRTAFNIPSRFGRYTEQWGGYPRPLAKFLPPPVFGVFAEDGQYEDFLYSTTKYAYESNSVGQDEILAARAVANLLSVPKDGRDVMVIVIDALMKYQRALDLDDWGLAFLSFWQALERITLQGRHISMKEVVARTDALISSKDHYERDLLDALYATRNRFVHAGRFVDEGGLDEVGLLKSVVDAAISALLSRRDELGTESALKEYYESHKKK